MIFRSEMILRRGILAAISVVLAGRAVAQQTVVQPEAEPQSQPAEPPPPRLPEINRLIPNFELVFTPGIWLPRLVGDTRLTNADRSLSFADDLRLNGSQPTFNGELRVRKHETYDLWFGGFGFSSQGTSILNRDATFGSLQIDDGDRVDSSIDITSFFAEIEIGTWRAYTDDPDSPPDPKNITDDGRYVVDLRAAPEFGIRYFDIDQSVAVRDGDSAHIETEWLAVYGGLEIEMQYRPPHHSRYLNMLSLQVSGSVGPVLGGDGGVMWQVRAGLSYDITPNIGAMVGYRLVELNVEDGDYAFDAGLQGLFLAGRVRF